MLFATIYTYEPSNAFYNTTAKYEPKVEAQRRDVADDIQRAFLEQHPSFAQTLFLNESRYLPRLFTVASEPDGTKVTFRPYLKPPFMEAADTVSLSFRKEATFHPWEIEPGRFRSDTLIEVEVHAEQIEGNKREISETFPCAEKTPDTTTCLRMYEHDYTDLWSLSFTEAGFPGQNQRSFARELYFSFVTISTLGHGDIVPITDTARFLVVAEALFGPVILSLFLNSLARSRTDSPPGPSASSFVAK